MTTTQTITIGSTDVLLSESGEGHPILLLHGGGGPQTVAGFAELLASSEHAHVVAPTHPGWGGTVRPDDLTTIRGLAELYGRMLEQLDLVDVTVVGSSIGGWLAAEMALLHSPRISSVVLIGATGLVVPGHPIADFFLLTMDQVVDLSYFEPATFRIDLSALPPAAQAVMAGNREALAVYAGGAMVDDGLAERLTTVTVPVLVISGEADQIVDREVGEAYAAAMPGATFLLMSETGHMPQLETPDRLLTEVWTFADAHAIHRPTP